MNITLVVPGKSIPTVEAVNNYLLGRAFEQVGGAIKEENMPALVEAFVGRPGTFDVSANVTKTAAESMLRQKLEAIQSSDRKAYARVSIKAGRK